MPDVPFQQGFEAAVVDRLARCRPGWDRMDEDALIGEMELVTTPPFDRRDDMIQLAALARFLADKVGPA